TPTQSCCFSRSGSNPIVELVAAPGESRKPAGDVRRSRFAHATRISLILARDVQRAVAVAQRFGRRG
ncbi:MAG TPA: hypothetical protein VLP43_12040, partial [Solirubrobacteraceae bacterium]|nr:hypothetical protein [Solirubrobacteraceae bacterium]